MKSAVSKCLFAIPLALGISQSVLAADVSVKLTNLTHGSYFTPLLVTAHDSMSHLFTVGTAASAGLRIMAECGDISMLSADMGGVDMDTVENPAAGLLGPGQSTTTNLMTAAENTHLSLVAMVLPSNDGFVGLDSMLISTQAGTHTYYLNAYDAGTEANDELLPGSECMAGVAGIPAAPGMDGGTGGSAAAMADSNAMVHVHRGVLGDTDAAGGISDLNSSIHRWQNPVAKITVTVQ